MTQSRTINGKAAIAFGWRTAWKNILLFLGIGVITFLISFAVDALSTAVSELTEQQSLNALTGLTLIFVVIAIDTVWQVFYSLGLSRLALDFIDTGKSTFGRVFSQGALLWRGLGVTLLTLLIVVVGFLLLIIPGIIWSIKYSMAMYCLVDKKLGVKESLKMSAELTRGVKWQLFGFWLVLGLINLAGFLALVIGMVITVPLTMLAQAHVYRHLTKQAGSASDVQPAPASAAPAAPAA